MRLIRFVSMGSIATALSACAIQAPIPRNTVQAGCATVLEAEDTAPTLAPEFLNPIEKNRSQVSTSEIGSVVGAIPGVGLIANVAITVGTAMTAEAVINNANQIGNVGDKTAPVWKGVKQITVQPDFGEPYSIRYLGLKSASKGSRVIVSVDKNRNDDSKNLYIQGFAYLSSTVPTDKITDAYMSICYGVGDNGYHQVAFKEGKFVEVTLPDIVQKKLNEKKIVE